MSTVGLVVYSAVPYITGALIQWATGVSDVFLDRLEPSSASPRWGSVLLTVFNAFFMSAIDDSI